MATDLNTQSDGTEVAMLGAVAKAGSQVPRIKRNRLNPDAAVQTYRGNVLIREASPNEMAVFEATLPRIDGKPGSSGIQFYELNLNQMAEVFGNDLTAFQSKIVELNRSAIEEAKRGKVSIKDISIKANEIGLEDMMTRLLKRKEGKGFNTSEEAYKALIVQVSTLQMARHAYDTLIKEGTEEAASNFLGAMTLQGAVTSSLIGAKAETARIMSVYSNFNKVVDAQVSPSLEDLKGFMGDAPDMNLTPKEIVKNAGGIEAVQHMGVRYMALTDGQKSNLNRSSWRWVGKVYDAFVESFLMSILSGPTTHAVNILSNSATMISEIPINVIAASIGKLRGTEDAISFREAFVDVIATYHALGDAMRASAQAFKTEQPSDFVTKLDYKRQAISAEKFEIDPNSGIGQVFDAYGRIIRLPGRFLLATDEAFKAIAMRQKIYREAISVGMKAKRLGKTADEINKEIAQLINNPPETVREAAEDYARYKTFQTPVSGQYMTTLQQFSNVPPFKFLMPFFQTPTNIIAQVFEHSPAAFATKRFREEIGKGGKHADVAMARMLAGSGMMGYYVMASMGMFGNETMMTGYGPTEPKARKNWLDQGFRPYSFVKKNEDGSYTSTSYSRFDPISGLLAIAADTGWHIRHNPDDPSAVVMAALGASYHYLNELPMMEGFGEITKLFRGDANEDPVSMMERVSDMYGKAMAKAVPGFLPVSPTGSLANSIQRYMDPEKRDKTFPEEARQFFSNYAGTGPLDGVVQSYYETLQHARSLMPWISKDVPVQKDRFNNIVTESNGQAYEMVSPIRRQDTMFSSVHDELRNLQYGLPDRHRSIKGVELSIEQKNRYIELANTLEDPKSNMNLLGQLNATIQKYKSEDPEGTTIMRGDRINFIEATDKKYWNLARKHMEREFPELNLAIKEAQQNRKIFGPKMKSMVPNPE